jgi:hypothetical protein
MSSSWLSFLFPVVQPLFLHLTLSLSLLSVPSVVVDLSLVEWPERLGSLLPAHALSVTITDRQRTGGEEEDEDNKEDGVRQIELESAEPRWRERIERWKREGVEEGSNTQVDSAVSVIDRQ